MRHIHLKGSSQEIGLQAASVLAEERKNGYPPNYPEEVLEKSMEYNEQVKLIAPEFLEELHVISDTHNIDYRRLVTLELSPLRWQSSCLVMAISGEHTSDGLPVLARNQEWMESDAENLRVIHSQPDGRLKSVGTNFAWTLASRYGGMNEAGVALAAASATFDDPKPGIIINVATRWVLENCRTTKEAVDFLESMPKVWGETYIIVDKNNTIAKVESHRKRTVTTYSSSGFAYNTLLYDTTEMRQLVSSERMDRVGEIQSIRKDFIEEWFKEHKGTITTELIKNVLKDHEHKVCYHSMEGLEVCWSYILEPTEQNLLFCQGRPCKNEYVAFKPKFS